MSIPLDALEKRISELEEQRKKDEETILYLTKKNLDLSSGSLGFSVIEYLNLNEIPIEDYVVEYIGSRAAELCHDFGYPIGKTHHKKYGELDTYPEALLVKAHKEIEV